jgi:hypothetical protein
LNGTPVAAPRAPGFKMLRVLILLTVLLAVAVNTFEEGYRTTRWRVPLIVSIYPMAADLSSVTRDYVDGLDEENFKPIDRFFAREALRYHLKTDQPIETRLHAGLRDMPPQRAADDGVLRTMWWSLRMRYWAWRVSANGRDPQDIRMFVLYHDPKLTPTVPHSLGLSKGLIGVVYAFAADWMSGANDVVIAHELLHTVGASDKYNPKDDSSSFPYGYGNPRQVPLYPQQFAELMAGRRMLAPNQWVEAQSLDEVVIGAATALEIRWTRSLMP